MRQSLACSQAPTADQAEDVANELLSSFYAGEIDRVELVYTSFISMIASKPTVRASYTRSGVDESYTITLRSKHSHDRLHWAGSVAFFYDYFPVSFNFFF